MEKENRRKVECGFLKKSVFGLFFALLCTGSSVFSAEITALAWLDDKEQAVLEIKLDGHPKYSLSSQPGKVILKLKKTSLEHLTSDYPGLAPVERIQISQVTEDILLTAYLNQPAMVEVEPRKNVYRLLFSSENADAFIHQDIKMAQISSLIRAEGDSFLRMGKQQNIDDMVTRQPPTTVFQKKPSEPEFHQQASVQYNNLPRIQAINFRRTVSGAGRVIIDTSHDNVNVTVLEKGAKIVATFKDVVLPSYLEQRLDVVDFATPVSFIDSYAEGRDTILTLSLRGAYKQSSIQTVTQFILDVSPLTQREDIDDEVAKDEFVGEKISLNFQKISVRAALQVIADFTDINFITSDAVLGDLSLRLRNVPWDQALDVILQAKGLSMRQTGNVIWVAPADEVLAKEQQVLQAQLQSIELEPLVSEVIPLSYARAENLSKIIKSVRSVDTRINPSLLGSVSVAEIKTEENTLLSTKGSVGFDSRTNILLVQDTVSKIKEIKALVAKLDIPVRQVLIETRIVQANDDFSKNIGVRLGFTRITRNARLPFSGATGDIIATGSLNNVVNIGQTNQAVVNNDALSVNLPASAIGNEAAGSYAFSISKLGSGFSNLLDLELSALQAEGQGKILANPKILTTDKRKATISQGQERLSVFNSAFGTSSSEGQRAVLSLTVLPQITPNDQIIMDVEITNDTFVAANSDTVNTKRIDTQALLENGETVIIGGIYTQNETHSVSKVPLLGDIPYLGRLFRKNARRNNRTELLIFLTPRIVDPTLAVQ